MIADALTHGLPSESGSPKARHCGKNCGKRTEKPRKLGGIAKVGSGSDPRTRRGRVRKPVQINVISPKYIFPKSSSSSVNIRNIYSRLALLGNTDRMSHIEALFNFINLASKLKLKINQKALRFLSKTHGYSGPKYLLDPHRSASQAHSRGLR